MCDCCDHPLQHAIAHAISALENGVSRSTVISWLEADVEQWQEDQAWRFLPGH